MYRLDGKTALVTGAAKRIGEAISVGLAQQEANVIIHYSKSKEKAQELREKLLQMDVKAWLVAADFNHPDSCKRLIEEAHKLTGGIDILVNNASVFKSTDLSTVNLEHISAEIMTNTWAPFLLSRYFSEQTNAGKIVNLLDTRIAGYDFDHFAYYLSKRMLHTLTESLALKLAPNISVNAVAPGLVLPPEGKDVSYLEQKKDMVPMKKHGEVTDVVDAVLFLLRSDFITGQVIYVDGGKHLIQTIEGV